MEFTVQLKDASSRVIIERKSHRVYTEEKMSLLAVSYLLWATQGVKSIRGNNYATLRTVPSGGARHPFETYLLVRDVEGLKSGLYHYLPLEHSLEYLQAVDDIKEAIDEATLPYLFDPYVKGVIGQFGLGLSIVSKIASMFQYSVTAKNHDVGVSFIFQKKKK